MANFDPHAFLDGAETVGYSLAGAIMDGHLARRADAARASAIRAQTARMVAAHQGDMAARSQRARDAADADLILRARARLAIRARATA